MISELEVCMIDYVIKKIEQKDRNNIKYLHPIKSNEAIGKYISAFSNSQGGLIVFGVKDDGKNLIIKNFPFNIKECDIRNLLEEHVKFECVIFDYMEHHLAYINVNKNNIVVKSNNVAYVFNNKMEVEEMVIKKVFLSYCHKDSCIADIIENKIVEIDGSKIEISRDTRKVKYKDSLDEYMQSIKDHDFVISIVSDGYFRSIPCMYEVAELMRDRNYYDKLLFVIISDEDIKFYENKDIKIKADIYSNNRFDYIKYWEDEKIKIDNKVAEFKNPALMLELTEESKQLEIISLNVGTFIARLKDGLGESFKNMLSSDFKNIISIILDSK
ncbi:signal transduction protein [Clostridium botulinum]|nr:signal transduction protein [Clostridium botulinum]NFL44732.1 signal transduction protein [Clostridium botulinum]NFL89143.1 signal transduction protein [Clostridium botulinum]